MKKLLLLCSALILFFGLAHAQQTRQVTGKVTDKSGKETIPGASVTIKGTSVAVSTDEKGQFKMTIPATGNIVLIARYIGYKPQEITVGTQSKISFALEDDVAALDEVVINIGYGTVRKEALTGAVSSVSAKDLADFPVSSAAQALAGKLAGVTVTTTEGSPGADINIRVRGGTSLTNDNSPLYIVDGVQIENALSIISPNEIQSIDVLKDVASTSIYGARGANGVVIITTKGGKEMRTTVNFEAYGGARQIVNTLDVMNPAEFVRYQYHLYNYNTDDATKKTFVDKYGTFEDLGIYKNIPKINWQDEVFGRNALSSTQILSLTGGTKVTTFNFNLNNTKEDGIMLESGYRRTFASFRFDTKISDKFRTGVNVRYSRQRVDGIGTSSTGSNTSNRLRNAVRYQPYSGTTESGDILDPDYLTTALTNPVSLAHSELKYDYRNDLISSGYVSYSILKNLTFKTVLGLNTTDRKTNTFNGVLSGVARQNGSQPVVVLANSSTLAFTNTNTLSYTPNLGKDHSLDLLAGQEINLSNTQAQGSTTKYFPADISAKEAFASIQKAEPPAGYIQDKPTSAEYGTRLSSFFGRANYAYKGKYLATLSIRKDGSSLFGPEHKWGTFPSAQVAWRVTEEKFMKDLDLNWLNNLKVRLSYGTGGNNRIPNDLFQTLFTASSTAAGYPVNDTSPNTGLYAPNFANPAIKWESVISRNAGLDFTLFNNRLTASVDMYINDTKDLLLLAKVPPVTGYASQQKNTGKTQNKGIELQLNGVVAQSKNFTYNASFNIAFNKNIIKALQPGVMLGTYQSGWVNDLADFLVEIGKPVGQFYGYVSDGYYKLEDFNTTVNSSGVYTYTLKSDVPNDRAIIGNKDPQPGDMKVKKLSSSSSMTIGDDDKTVLGNSQPKFTGGFNNQFAWKNFDMSVFVNFSYGNKEYNANKLEFSSQYNVKDNNLLAIMSDRWNWFDGNGQKVTNPTQLADMNANAKYWTPSTGNYVLTSFAIEDASFLRINNVTLGYSLPKQWLSRTKALSKVRIYATVNNLYTFTKYTGYDPEASTRRDPLTPGVDYAAYPRSRYILAGVQVGF